jgi:hypothetical protein
MHPAPHGRGVREGSRKVGAGSCSHVRSATVDAAVLGECVRDMYGDVADQPDRAVHFETGRSLAERLGAPADWLDAVPSDALASFAGGGHMLDLERISPCLPSRRTRAASRWPARALGHRQYPRAEASLRFSRSATSPELKEPSMFKRISPFAVGAVALGLGVAACGSGGGGGAIAPETAKARVEQAANVKLAETPFSDEARDQGLRVAYTNGATVAQDQQVVGLFVLKSADTAEKLRDYVSSQAPASSKLIVNDEVMVLYAANGNDRSAAVEKAVKGL